MKGDIAFAGFMLTAEEWKALDSETRHQLVAVATRRFPAGTAPPASAGLGLDRGSRATGPSEARDPSPPAIPAHKTFISGGTIIEESPVLAQGSGPLETDEYIDLFDD